MKKIILSLFIGCVTFSLNAQSLFELEQVSQTGNPTSYQSQGNKQRLDSLTVEAYDESTMQWNNTYKSMYAYDAHENQTKSVIYEWNENTTEWIVLNNQEYMYDSNGNLILHVNRSYADTEVTIGFKFERSYDANNNVILYISHSWNNNQWEPSLKTEYSYDSNNYRTLLMTYKWDGIEWKIDTKTEYTYDANGNQILSLRYYWDIDTEQWLQSTQYEYSYNNDNNLTSAVRSSWSYNQWMPISKDEYTYDNNQILNIYSRWSDNQWEFDRKDEEVYDSNNRLISTSYFLWYQSLEQWKGTDKYEYTFDIDDNYTQDLRYSWDDDNNQWRYDFRLNYNYDNTYSYNDLITKIPEVESRHKRTDYTRDVWDVATGEWMLETGRGTYHYSEQLVGIENIVQAGIQVFPNPAGNQVFFDLPPTNQATHIQLYDAQGKIADIQPINNNRISVEHLDSGIYFYQLSHNDRQYGGQLIVK